MRLRVTEAMQSSGALAEKPFRLLWLARTTSSVGSAFASMALAFAVFSVGGSALSLGLVLTSGAVARLVFLLLGGVWADRLPRKQLMISADVIRMICQGVMAVLQLTGHASVWQFAVANMVVSGASAFFLPASTGLVAEVVSAPRLQQANGLLAVSNNTASFVGPALSGLLVAAVGPGYSFVIDAASFAGSAIFLSAVPVPGRTKAARQHWIADLAEGWHGLSTRRWCWQNLLGHAFWNLGMAVLLVLGPIVARESLGGAVGWGLISAGLSAGAVVGGLAIVWTTPRRPLFAGNLGLLLGGLPLLALAGRQPLYVVIVASVVAFAGMSFMDSLWTTALQQMVPMHVLARISSYDNLVSYAILPIGFVVSGSMAAAVGVRSTLIFAAAVMVIPSAIIAVLPSVRQVRRGDDGIFASPSMEAANR